MIYINNCKLLIINKCKDIKKYQLLNYSPLLVPPTSPSPSHSSPLCPCGLHPLRVSSSLSEFFIKKYFSHFQLTTKNFQKKLRKNLQDKKKRRTFAPANETKHSLKTRNNTYIDIMLYSTKQRFKELSET